MLRRREERFFSEQVSRTLSWHNIPVRERADGEGACTGFALFSFSPVLVPQCLFASVWKPEDPPYGSTWSSCVTRCCWANCSVKSVKPNWPAGLLESYGCQIDFAQSSPAQTTLGLSANWKLLHSFLPFPSKAPWSAVGAVWFGNCVLFSQQAPVLLKTFWKSERLMLIYMKECMCREGGFSINRWEICMWMEPSAPLCQQWCKGLTAHWTWMMLTSLKSKQFLMDRGQSPTWAPHRSSNCKRAHEGAKIFWSLLQKK